MVNGNRADAQAGQEHDHSDLAHHDHYTPPGDERDWPPRPVGAGPLQEANPIAADAIGGPNPGNPIALNAVGGRASAAAGANDASDAIAAVIPAGVNNRELSDALGADFSLISHAEARQGKYDSIGQRWTWFSRSNNQTVVVIENQDGSLAVERLSASEMQPIISRQERVWAHEIGMAWLLDNGFEEAVGLNGTSIRALDDGDFYDVRMAYVTFATDNFADPTHSVLVDLTNLVAVSGRSL